ncbi:hypothetical protein HRR80_000702 [Exophiala dermatitidis]|uniref:Uncharacterized protein n=1 Tax=Exophiala dermatitidis TaxID=5970 RepID=A0AAN6IYJ3_EXODE|nr:hypothetical protein HRR86_009597 [Exophiala dermatitidis]KAJ4698104.1 hypothetical protein HRR87_009296 [Exophiala dermatitidis]KAJ8995954.1 hypothetical protein HRR80_000702 [Exophiala dermatitidis]
MCQETCSVKVSRGKGRLSLYTARHVSRSRNSHQPVKGVYQFPPAWVCAVMSPFHLSIPIVNAPGNLRCQSLARQESLGMKAQHQLLENSHQPVKRACIPPLLTSLSSERSLCNARLVKCWSFQSPKACMVRPS